MADSAMAEPHSDNRSTSEKVLAVHTALIAVQQAVRELGPVDQIVHTHAEILNALANPAETILRDLRIAGSFHAEPITLAELGPEDVYPPEHTYKTNPTNPGDVNPAWNPAPAPQDLLAHFLGMPHWNYPAFYLVTRGKHAGIFTSLCVAEGHARSIGGGTYSRHATFYDAFREYRAGFHERYVKNLAPKTY